jgi:alpha-ketoglutarate-dependent taurine dioxygenase
MPIEVIPTGETLGATIEGLDLAGVSGADVDASIQALGRYGVIRFPRQHLSPTDLKNFSAHLGELEINVVGTFQEPGHPEVMILSNMVENGGRSASPTQGKTGIRTCRTARSWHSPTCSMPSPSRSAVASRWAPPSSATCARLTRACPPR